MEFTAQDCLYTKPKTTVVNGSIQVQVVKTIQEAGGKAVAVKADVSKLDEVTALFKESAEAFPEEKIEVQYVASAGRGEVGQGAASGRRRDTAATCRDDGLNSAPMRLVSGVTVFSPSLLCSGCGEHAVHWRVASLLVVCVFRVCIPSLVG